MIEKIRELFLRLASRFIPARVLYITSKCPLRKDCNITIRSMIVTSSLNFKDTDIIDVVFKSISRHLKVSHKVEHFIGLEFYPCADEKYYIQKGAANVKA